MIYNRFKLLNTISRTVDTGVTMSTFDMNNIVEEAFHPKDIYAIYLRKSRADVEAEKLGEGETLARHKKILTELAARKGLYIGKIYQEIVSGELSKPDRRYRN